MSTRLYLVRHGVTGLTTENRFSGASDPPLSDEGQHQAQRLAQRLATAKIAAFYASPLLRARETAALVARPHRLEPAREDGLREISHGRWEGLTRSEVETHHADEYAAWEADPFTFAPEGGETGLSVLARALPVVRRVVAAHEGEAAVLVSHKATLRLLLCTVLGIDPRGYRDRLDQSPCCLNVVDFQGPVKARLMLFNDVSHYAADPKHTQQSLSRWWDAMPPR